jgi:PTS system N-acetylglucosamine-specific IIC component
MMFGLPAACLAMYRTAHPQKRKAVGGMLFSMALTSFLTGVTEPIEFTFMFLAPALYALHAVLTGLALVTMDLLGSKMGFGFSAGMFDYALNFNKSTHPLYLVPVGAVYFALYYVLFRYFILRFDLKTPGRELDDDSRVASGTTVVGQAEPGGALADSYIAALGGAANLQKVDACTTRLRLELADRAAIDAGRLRVLGARGTVNIGEHGIQVVIGPEADQLAGEMRERLSQSTPARASLPRDRLLAALGGRANVREVTRGSSRVIVQVADSAAVDEASLAGLFARGIARPAPSSLHLLHEAPGEIVALLA